MKPTGAVSQLLSVVILLVAVAVLYYPSIAYDFHNWDDTAYIHEDEAVRKGLSKGSLHHAFTTFKNPYFMPLTRLSYMLDVSLFGLENAAGFRLVNILLHTAVSLLLFFLLWQLTRNYLPALAAALLFALHPQHVEAVVWIAGRKEVLAALFGMLSLFCYQQYIYTKRREWYLLTVMSFVLSLLCKPMWLVLPFLLLIWDFFPLQRLRRETAIQCLVEKLPLLLIAVFYALVFSLLLSVNLATEVSVSFIPDEPWPRRWMFFLMALGSYITHTFWPFDLLPYYAFPEAVNIAQALGWMFLVLVLLAVFWRIRNSHAGFLMAALWFGVALAAPLRLSIFPAGEAMFVGDRLSYMAHIGMFSGLVLAAYNIHLRYNTRALAWSLLVMLLLVLASYSWSSKKIVEQWQSGESLWLYALEHTDGIGQAFIMGALASEYDRQERYQKALIFYRTAHEINKQPYIFPMMVGSLLNQPFQQRGESDRWFDKIIDVSPAPAGVLFTHGKLELRQGRAERAEMFLQAALERRQETHAQVSAKQIRVTLGIAQIRSGKLIESLETLSGVRLLKEEKQALCNLYAEKKQHPDYAIVMQDSACVLKQ